MTKSMIFFLVVTTCIMVGTIAFLPQYDIIVSAGIRILAMAIAIYYTVRFKEWRIIPPCDHVLFHGSATDSDLPDMDENHRQHAAIQIDQRNPGHCCNPANTELDLLLRIPDLRKEQDDSEPVQPDQSTERPPPDLFEMQKVRNDEGYWQQIDTYIEQNTDTEFSHGLCEDCMKELYGNEPWYKNIEDRKKT